MFFDRFEELCNRKGVSPSRAAVEAGINKSTVTYWKNNETAKPTGQIAERLCSYFGVSMNELYRDPQKENPPAQDEQEEMYELLEEMRRNPDIRTMFSLTKNAKPEEVRQFIAVIKALRGSNDE